MVMEKSQEAGETTGSTGFVPLSQRLVAFMPEKLPSARAAFVVTLGVMALGNSTAETPLATPPSLGIAEGKPLHPSKQDKQVSVPSRSVHTGNHDDISFTMIKGRSTKGKDSCTTLRIKPNDIAVGRACAENGDTAVAIPNTEVRKGWSYSLLRMPTPDKKQIIYKCLYAKAGMLPELKDPDPALVNACESYYIPLAKQNFVYMRRYNCDFIGRRGGVIYAGLQGCRSGTFRSPIAANCKDLNVYYNFATNNPSPWNVLGDGPGGFSGRVDTKNWKAVSYRVEFTMGSQTGELPIVIRGLKRQHPWALMDTSCVGKKHRRDGTPTMPNTSVTRHGKIIYHAK